MEAGALADYLKQAASERDALHWALESVIECLLQMGAAKGDPSCMRAVAKLKERGQLDSIDLLMMRLDDVWRTFRPREAERLSPT